jgi:hypothetical protein
MAYEVTAVLTVSENTESGALVSVAETETLGVVSWPDDLSPSGFVIATFEAMREQIDTALAALRVKALGQIDGHLEQLREGTHPMQHAAPPIE